MNVGNEQAIGQIVARDYRAAKVSKEYGLDFCCGGNKTVDEAGEAMARIRSLSNNFRLPDDACTTYGVLYENLKVFEKNLHKHVHLENNILFPKALELERQLNNNSSFNIQAT